MRNFRGTAAMIGLCAALAASPTWAASSPFIGQWHWDPGQSTVPPGESAPSALTTEFVSVADGHVVWSVTIVPLHGRPYVETFEVPADGEAYPIGSDTTASLRLAGDTLHVTFEGSAGQSDAFTCTLSPDHRTMTCRGVLDEGNGQTTSYVDVYDRI
jgi:hypothetical protein